MSGDRTATARAAVSTVASLVIPRALGRERHHLADFVNRQTARQAEFNVANHP
jgi:hypothetical protein